MKNTLRDDGGPAFPRAGDQYSASDSQDGMSLRDYFAAQALPGIIAAWPVGTEYVLDEQPDADAREKWLREEKCPAIAAGAYAYADAMLAERAK